MLTVPYVVLVLVLAAAIGALSYHAGQVAVDSLSDRLLSEMVFRTSQAVERHVFGAGAVLETAFPTGVAAPATIEQELDTLRTRFWLATSVHRDPNNYAYYGDRHGQFFGLWRYSDSEAELRLRKVGEGPRTIYQFSGFKGELKNPVREERIFDPRERPWYKVGQTSALHTWTSIYIDFKSEELVATRARRVNNATGEFQGVVATDLSLQRVNDFLHTLKLSENGIAFVVENDGNLIGSSRGQHLSKNEKGANVRLNAAASSDALVSAAYKEIRRLVAAGNDASRPRTAIFDGPNHEEIQATYGRVQDGVGLDWLIVVAVPRTDFLSQVTSNFHRTIILTGLAALIVIVIGLLVLSEVARNLKKLAAAARDVGNGELGAKLDLSRGDEIGELAQSFMSMQTRLLTDRLTGLANREAFLRRMEERIIQQRRQGDTKPFAVLFIDLNKFKSINDTYGHDVGDKVLQEVAQRMVAGLRSLDVVARYAGDEFAVLLDAVNTPADAEATRTKLEELLGKPLQSVANANVATGAAVGMAMYPEHGRDVETLLKHADTDMYARK